MRKIGYRFSARIPLYHFGIDHVHDFGPIRSKVIVIYGFPKREPNVAGW